MAKKTVTIIEYEALIKIEVSGNFYARIQQMLLEMISQKPQVEVVKALEKLKSNEPEENVFEYNLHTIMSLIYEMEEQAKAQGKLIEKEIDIPDDDKAL